MTVDLPSLLSLQVLGQQTPWLPLPQTLPWLVRGLWALLLCSLCLGLLRRHVGGRVWSPGARLGLGATVLAACLLPGSLSPVWWLGLAFQAPSLMGVLLALAWALRPFSPPAHAAPAMRTGDAPDAPSSRWPLRLEKPGPWSTAGLVLGWLLLLDLLALTPVSIYAWGFGTPALAAVMLVGALLWAGTPPRRGARSGAACLALTLTLFVLTRWPSGNLWDALIDPWLWVVLHLRLFSRAGVPTGLR